MFFTQKIIHWGQPSFHPSRQLVRRQAHCFAFRFELCEQSLNLPETTLWQLRNFVLNRLNPVHGIKVTVAPTWIQVWLPVFLLIPKL